MPVSPETLDALAAFEAEAEDREDEPVEDQGDDGPSFVVTTAKRRPRAGVSLCSPRKETTMNITRKRTLQRRRLRCRSA